jgi:hypothetical protein
VFPETDNIVTDPVELVGFVALESWGFVVGVDPAHSKNGDPSAGRNYYSSPLKTDNQHSHPYKTRGQIIRVLSHISISDIFRRRKDNNGF